LVDEDISIANRRIVSLPGGLNTGFLPRSSRSCALTTNKIPVSFNQYDIFHRTAFGGTFSTTTRWKATLHSHSQSEYFISPFPLPAFSAAHSSSS
jgi:hypothetical protein